MGTELYLPDEYPGDAHPESDQFGTAVNGYFRWGPSWFGYADEDNRAAIVAWLRAHPDAIVPSDQGEWTAQRVLGRMGEDGRDGPTMNDLNAALARFR